MEAPKIITPMTDRDKSLWLGVRTRLKLSLRDKKSIIKNDLRLCFRIHKRVFGKPQTAPSINCCIDIALWEYMVTNINKAFVAKKVEE